MGFAGHSLLILAGPVRVYLSEQAQEGDASDGLDPITANHSIVLGSCFLHRIASSRITSPTLDPGRRTRVRGRGLVPRFRLLWVRLVRFLGNIFKLLIRSCIKSTNIFKFLIRHSNHCLSYIIKT